MEERKHLLDYLMRLFVCYGFTMLVMSIFTVLFGNQAKGFSPLFDLGEQGIPLSVSLQFFIIAAVITLFQLLFFTDYFISHMALWLRTALMLGGVFVLLVGCILLFQWFPPYDHMAWLLFVCCFCLSFIGSAVLASIKEKAENRRMEEALTKLKQREEKQ
ncbi:MAG: hypothetical protein HFE68_05100 [Erysipelotrichaceae bacterium]|nr:hypothetical protein [Erysipelotrichaceae bacterium]MCI9312724.1 hypothetical protein [Erysipelotrichaceae bacterium]